MADGPVVLEGSAKSSEAYNCIYISRSIRDHIQRMSDYRLTDIIVATLINPRNKYLSEYKSLLTSDYRGIDASDITISGYF